MTTTEPTASLRLGPEAPDASIDWDGLGVAIRHYALGLTRSTHEADDLAQETLARLIAHGVGSIDDPRAFAIRTATRLWLTRQRTVGRRARRLALLAQTLVRPGHPRTDALERAELMRLIERCVGTLPPRQRAALVLRCVEGLDHEAIATALGCSIAAARASLHLARRTLRSMLAFEHADHEPGDKEKTL